MPGIYEHLVVRKPMNVTELPHHDFSQVIPYPVLMGKSLVPEANAWALYLFIKEITQPMIDMAIGKDRAAPHKHDFDEMYLMIGDANAITFEVMLGDEAYEVATPGAVYIPERASTRHQARPGHRGAGRRAHTGVPERGIYHASRLNIFPGDMGRTGRSGTARPERGGPCGRPPPGPEGITIFSWRY